MNKAQDTKPAVALYGAALRRPCEGQLVSQGVERHLELTNLRMSYEYFRAADQ